MFRRRILVPMMCVSFVILFSGSGISARETSTPASTPPSAQGVIWTQVIKDVAQIFFWVTVPVVSIVTYVRARKTILQPLRTEVFKLQLEEMKKVLALFLGKRELDLREAFGLYKLVMANATMMYDGYAHQFFDIEVDHNKRPYAGSECPATIFTKDAMRNCTLMNG